MSIVFKERVINEETGELVSSRTITKQVKDTDSFIKTYIEDIGLLARCSGAEQSVVLCCLKYLDYNTNKLYIDSKTRLQLSECGGLKLNTVNTAISRLVKKNILIKESSSGYILNPKLFFFGAEIDREKMFQLRIQYNIAS
jgi:hypothetical protein